MSEIVRIKGEMEITISPQMKWAAYDVLSKWHSSNKLSSSGERMMDVSDKMLIAALRAAANE